MRHAIPLLDACRLRSSKSWLYDGYRTSMSMGV